MTQPGEDSARQAVEHLQRAVLETIAAARSALDAAEELVRDPATLTGLATAAATIAEALGGAMADARAAGRPRGSERTGEDARPNKVQHISVG